MKGSVKFLIVAALCVSVVRSAADSAIISPAIDAPATVGAALLDMVNSYQKIMPCGVPAIGLPVLVPYRQDLVELDIDQEILSLKGKITNLVVNGLNKFTVVDISTKGNRTTFDVIYEDIDILGEFDTKLYENLAGFKYHVNTSGLLNIHFKDVRITGGITITENIFGGMYFQDIDYYINIGDIVSDVIESQWSVALNNFVNKYTREATLLLVKENRQEISRAISAFLTPQLNVLAFATPKSDLIDEMVKATSSYNSVECNV